MATWLDYMEMAGPGQHTVTGSLRLLPGLWSPQLENHRDIVVYLPPAYADSAGRRYPVLYMHDGQNLFDQAASFAGEWHVDETMEELSQDGLEAIVVGVSNMGKLRLAEYTPFEDPVAGGGQGDQYLAFLVETIKPLIDADYRTLPAREHTGVLGSSLGGLISLYALFRYPSVFGLVGALSPSFSYNGGAMFGYIERAERPDGRIYMDVGTREAGKVGHASAAVKDDWSQAYLDSVREMHRLLIKKGYRAGDNLLYVEDEGGVHHESSWARRLPSALRFLLAAPSKPE